MPNNITFESTIERESNVEESDLDGTLLLTNRQTNQTFGMDKTGGYIWSKLETPLSVSKLCQSLALEFNVQSSQCAQEVLDFLNEMYKNSLIRLC